MLRNNILISCFSYFVCLQLTTVTSFPSRVETQVQSLIALKFTIQEQSKKKENTTMLEKVVCRFVSQFADFYTILHHFVVYSMQCEHFVTLKNAIRHNAFHTVPAHLKKN